MTWKEGKCNEHETVVQALVSRSRKENMILFILVHLKILAPQLFFFFFSLSLVKSAEGICTCVMISSPPHQKHPSMTAEEERRSSKGRDG